MANFIFSSFHQICGKVAPNIKALRAHELIHKKPKYECVICGKSFRHSGKLRVYISALFFYPEDFIGLRDFGYLVLIAIVFKKNSIFFNINFQNIPYFIRTIPIYIPAKQMHMNAISVDKNSVLAHHGRHIA